MLVTLLTLFLVHHRLIIHGTEDRTVPVQDAHSYLHELRSDPRRSPDAQQLYLVQGSDHMYKGYTLPVVERILDWYHQRKEARRAAPTSASEQAQARL